MNKNALPFDINEFLGTSSAGFVAHPEGFYLLKVTEIGGGGYKNGPGSYTRFATEIQMGPGADTSREDRPFSDMIGNGDLATLDKATPKQKERMARDKAAYKQIWEACLGGEEACRDYLTQLAEAGSAADNEVLVGRKYIAYLTVSKDGTNNYIRTRIPFNDANWKYAVDNTPGEEAATTAAPPQPSQAPPPEAAAPPPPPTPAPVPPADAPPPPTPPADGAAAAAPPPPPPPPKP